MKTHTYVIEFEDHIQRASIGDIEEEFNCIVKTMFGGDRIAELEEKLEGRDAGFYGRMSGALVSKNIELKENLASALESIHESCSERDAVIKGLTEKLATHEWQPIETAPKDGTRIILYDEYHGVRHGGWQVGLNFTGWNYSEKPNLWQPLPPKPESEKK